MILVQFCQRRPEVYKIEQIWSEPYNVLVNDCSNRLALAVRVLDDYFPERCNSKHHGPLLQLTADYAVMRCSFCDQLLKSVVVRQKDTTSKKRSSLTCVSACDWVVENKQVRCLSCNYCGPVP